MNLFNVNGSKKKLYLLKDGQFDNTLLNLSIYRQVATEQKAHSFRIYKTGHDGQSGATITPKITYPNYNCVVFEVQVNDKTTYYPLMLTSNNGIGYIMPHFYSSNYDISKVHYFVCEIVDGTFTFQNQYENGFMDIEIKNIYLTNF